MMLTIQKWRIGDCVELMREMPKASVDTIITSPPYWNLRDYGVDGQIGLEETLEEYHRRLLEVTAECMRVLKTTGVMFWNHGDSYSGSTKCLTMQNERLTIRMIDEQGWILRNRIIWYKNNGMPSSVQDRFTNKHEPVYMFVKTAETNYYYNKKTGHMQRDKPLGTKGEGGVDWDWKEVRGGKKKVSNWIGRDYCFDLDAVRVPFTNATEVRYRIELRANKKYRVGAPYKTNTPYQHDTARKTSQESPNRMWEDAESLERQISAGKNPGDVWTIHTQPFSGSHFAVFPTSLIEPMIHAACPAEICPVCGMARVRIAERVDCGDDGPSHQFGGKSHGGAKTNVADKQSPYYAAKTGGWTSCSCGAGWIAGTVLDPFCGSGTVLEVCRLLNRNAIGFELNPEYEPLIRERSMSHTPPLASYLGGDD